MQLQGNMYIYIYIHIHTTFTVVKSVGMVHPEVAVDAELFIDAMA